MHIVLESVSNGKKIEVKKCESDGKWSDEHGNIIEEAKDITTLNKGKVGTEVGGLLYESRYRIVEVVT